MKRTFTRNSLDGEEFFREIYVGNRSFNETKKFSSNFIRTTKYTLHNFCLKALFLQFQRLSNCYFLIIAILQSIPAISPLHPFSAIAPLIFVIFVSLIREAIEDINKYKSDCIINSDITQVYLNGKFSPLQWRFLRVGDIVKISEMEILPADVVVFASSSESGICYIETSSLDGEKNLKPKAAPEETNNNFKTLPLRMEGKIKCIKPNSQLYHFEGTLCVLEQKIILSAKQLLLRGSRLKNTRWIFGIVVYAGTDTKIMKNAEPAKNKRSSVEQKSNVYILLVFIFQIMLCVICSLRHFHWSYLIGEHHQDYIPGVFRAGHESFLMFFSYFLLFNTMIPISLIVSLEIVKMLQSIFIESDDDLFVKEKNRRTKVICSALNEELGQVEYLFTDKTGTLTCNKMEFKYAVIGDQIYGDQEFLKAENVFKVKDRRPTYVDNKAGVVFAFEDRKLGSILGNLEKSSVVDLEITSMDSKSSIQIYDQKALIKEFLLHLATCHECIKEETNEGQINFQGPSPDEIVLVDAARHMGLCFNERTNTSLLLDAFGSRLSLELLYLFEFNSQRKRMSVIIRHHNVIKLFTKGADNIVKARLDQKRKQYFLDLISNTLDDFSKRGLRTLCFAVKILSEEELSQFSKRWVAANSQIDREKQLELLMDEVENDLFLIGATAVEDKLQKKVPETIHDLIQAKIKVWMLTGDKLETAENIGKSCNLIQTHMNVIQLSSTDHKTLNEQLNQKKEIIELCITNNIPKCLLIEGETLAIVLKEKAIRSLFVDIMKDFESVICCRTTPKQKADVVGLARCYLKKITLSVGDGANDVNMIQEAHIGVGIYGEEGLRAVQASDYAIGEFQNLRKLILVHGRWSYLRVSEMILYFFYKNMIFTIPQFFFSFVCVSSGQSIFDDFYITLYNLVFTLLPLIVKGIFEQDVNYKRIFRGEDKEIELRDHSLVKEFYPNLYHLGQKNTIFNLPNFLKATLIGIFQSLILFGVCVFSFSCKIVNKSGHTDEMWMFSISYFTSIIFVVDLRLAVSTRYWINLTWFSFIATSLMSYFIYIWISDSITSLHISHTAQTLFLSCQFYFSVLLNLLFFLALDYFILFYFANENSNLAGYFRNVMKNDFIGERKKVLGILEASGIHISQSNPLVTSQNSEQSSSRDLAKSHSVARGSSKRGFSASKRESNGKREEGFEDSAESTSLGQR